jgi:hypothetical protein
MLWAFERRWVHAVLEAFAPPDAEGLAPRAGEVDFVSAFERMVRSCTWQAALGTRLALWMAALAPLWMGGRLCSVVRLRMKGRTSLVRALLGHRSFVVRELTTLLKMAASLALLGNAHVRARSGYDRDVPDVWGAHTDPEEAWESGTRRKLPVVRDDTREAG